MAQPALQQFEGDREVFEIVRRFESGELPPAEFNHRKHLTVALWYASRHDAAEVPAVMRRRLRQYLDSHGLGADVYHETLTRFWVRRVGAFLDGAGRNRSLYELANELCGAAGDSRLVKDYYSEAVIESEEARRGWVEPDLRPLDF